MDHLLLLLRVQRRIDVLSVVEEISTVIDIVVPHLILYPRHWYDRELSNASDADKVV